MEKHEIKNPFTDSKLFAAHGASGSDVTWKIRREAIENSQIMKTLHFLADVHGPRLTGSPRFKRAADWAANQLKEWGLSNVHLEPWDFGHPGWENERMSVHLVSPVKDALVCEVVAWTPGTNGRVRAQAIQMVTPEKVTDADFTVFLDGWKDKVKGKAVLVGAHVPVPTSFQPVNKRRDEAEVKSMYDPNNPNPSPFGPRTPRATAPTDGKGPKTLTLARWIGD